MFEKEAEEYAEGMAKYYESAHGSVPSQFEKYLRKAVEYGYNKANEWHYVKDGDLKKKKKKVLVQLKDVEEPILDYYRQDGLWNYALEKEVIAWKEIVLPELPKESE